MRFNRFTSRLLGFFLRGLLLLAPLFVTVYIIYSLFNWIDSKFYFYFPGGGLLTVLGVILFIGWIGSTFIAVPAMRVLEEGLSHLPLVRIIYFSVKDLVSAFVGNQKKFNQAVLVKLDKNTEVWRMGFITQTDLKDLNIKNLVAVYLPQSYAFAGDLFFVPPENVMMLNIPTAEAMKFIVSGGVSKSPEPSDGLEITE
ncbi:MAG: DUF502 domain-containing protein [Spirosomataceae bacterium]